MRTLSEITKNHKNGGMQVLTGEEALSLNFGRVFCSAYRTFNNKPVGMYSYLIHGGECAARAFVDSRNQIGVEHRPSSSVVYLFEQYDTPETLKNSMTFDKEQKHVFALADTKGPRPEIVYLFALISWKKNNK